MLIRLCTLLMILAIYPAVALCQELPKKSSRPVFVIEITKGEAVLPSYFEPPNFKGRLVKVISIYPEIRDSSWYINGNIGFSANDRDTKNIGFSSRGKIFAIGPIHGDVGIVYSYSKDNSTPFKNNGLELIGSTRKYLGLLEVGGGLGSYEKSHFRISYTRGAIYTLNNLYIYTNSRLSNTTNNNFGDDALEVTGTEVLTSLRLFKVLILEGTGKRLVSNNNKQKILPPEQLLFSGKANVFIFRNFGLSIRGAYSSEPHGAILPLRSAEAGLVLKF